MRAYMANAECVAVRGRAGDAANGNAAPRTRNVLDHHGLSERTRHALGHDPGDRVRGTACGKWHDHGDRVCRVALCPSREGKSQKSMKKNGAQYLHFYPLPRRLIKTRTLGDLRLGL